MERGKGGGGGIETNIGKRGNSQNSNLYPANFGGGGYPIQPGGAPIQLTGGGVWAELDLHKSGNEFSLAQVC